jgi:hypothetical protein
MPEPGPPEPVPEACAEAPPPRPEAWWEADDACPPGAAIEGDPAAGGVHCRRDGVDHGPFSLWHASTGREAVAGGYREGLPHGHWRQYWPSGQIGSEGAFRLGERCGTWTYWDAAGNVAHVEDHEP